jgi:hypothetical protein
MRELIIGFVVGFFTAIAILLPLAKAPVMPEDYDNEKS